LKDDLKPIPGFEGKYSASRDGRIYSHKREYYLKGGFNTAGYPVIQFNIGKKVISYLVSRVIATTFLNLSLYDKDWIVHHKDSDPLNNDVNNLEIIHRSKHSSIHSPRIRLDTDTHKRCNKCQQLKLRNEFNKCNSLLDGFNSICRNCCKQERRGKYYGL
jgi:hypothetical protein